MAMTDPRDDVAELVASMDAHLAATEELALEEEANRWLGEAHAIATDVAEGDLDEQTLVERVEKVLELLDEVDGTGHEEADQHVAAAERAGKRVLDRQ